MCSRISVFKKIAIASDHGGFELKEQLKNYISKYGVDVLDLGTDNETSVDYPDFGAKAGIAVADGEADGAIVICGSGIGISISANKIPGIRAALCWDTYTAKMSRMHNDSNVLALGGRIITFDRAVDMVDLWLTTPFEGGRHRKRIDKLDVLAAERWRKYLSEEK
ncbi:ribose 5-phosphate isomerase B [Geovibrio thiophilus]|uniref:Ribose 5-phosphate isomerase B n=1 Tax=Geovibrio thiophilus TaxID=139438 RepID=A0A3R5V1W8_9BACT|nr:ribose 5-phosphate isomerase B [Geovibrio thiophilus]QAR33593.1 ribose 5-phosphate isomerase B [Geovibrio thiophilus]